MKVLYIYTSPSLAGSSVQTKVLSQIHGLCQAGLNCRGAFFSTEVSEQQPLNPDVDLLPVAKSAWRYFRSSGKKRKLMQAVLLYAERQHQHYDVILFRYPGAGYFLNKFMRLCGSKTAFEHLSIELEEIRMHAADNPMGLSVSAILSHLEYVSLPLWREYMYGASIRKKARLGICNSQAIANRQCQLAGGTYKTFINGDAVDTDDFSVHKTPALKETLHMVFLKGASTSAAYNGLERLFKGMHTYAGEQNIHLHILGRQLDYEHTLIKKFPGLSEKISLHGYLTGTGLDEFMNRMHIGVSQFGIHKKGLTSNSTIKSREYFARGLPFIFGHHDPDISGQAVAEKYTLEFPANDDPVNMETVIKWYNTLADNKETAFEMRQFAESVLDYRVKMQKLADFLKSVF